MRFTTVRLLFFQVIFGGGFLVLVFSVPQLWGRGQSEAEPPVIVRTSKNITHDYSTTTENEESDKLVIGREEVEPGIEFYFGGVLIYEGGLKDTVYPSFGDLEAGEIMAHLEARANWSTKFNRESPLPPGAAPGGFVSYLDITAKIENQITGYQTVIDLSPHINLENNLHYARNTPLPGSSKDLYTISFFISSPAGKSSVLFEKDWKQSYGLQLLEKTTFHYRNVAFAKVSGSN